MPSGEPSHELPLATQAFNAQLDDIAVVQEHWRYPTQTHPPRGARGDQIAGLERHEATDVPHQEADVEHHRRRRTILHPAAVDVEVHPQSLLVGDLVPGHEPRPDRAEGIQTLALDPLPRSF